MRDSSRVGALRLERCRRGGLDLSHLPRLGLRPGEESIERERRPNDCWSGAEGARARRERSRPGGGHAASSGARVGYLLPCPPRSTQTSPDTVSVKLPAGSSRFCTPARVSAAGRTVELAGGPTYVSRRRELTGGQVERAVEVDREHRTVRRERDVAGERDPVGVAPVTWKAALVVPWSRPPPRIWATVRIRPGGSPACEGSSLARALRVDRVTGNTGRGRSGLDQHQEGQQQGQNSNSSHQRSPSPALAQVAITTFSIKSRRRARVSTPGRPRLRAV